MTEDTCLWKCDPEEQPYETACGHRFYFDSGDVGENGFDWCPYCGKPIRRPESGGDPER